MLNRIKSSANDNNDRIGRHPILNIIRNLEKVILAKTGFGIWIQSNDCSKKLVDAVGVFSAFSDRLKSSMFG